MKNGFTSPGQYNTGDIIRTYDSNIGIIIECTSVSKYLSFEQHVKSSIAHAYTNIPIYKILMSGTIVYVSESNIDGIVKWEKKN